MNLFADLKVLVEADLRQHGIPFDGATPVKVLLQKLSEHDPIYEVEKIMLKVQILNDVFDEFGANIRAFYAEKANCAENELEFRLQWMGRYFAVKEMKSKEIVVDEDWRPKLVSEE